MRGVAVTYGNIKKPMSLSRLGMLMQQNGFAGKRINHGRTRGWIVRERTIDEVHDNRINEGKGDVGDG